VVSTAKLSPQQPLIGELRWFFLESQGDMGLRSNFESVARRIGGVYGTPQTSGDLDGRMFAAATRFKRVSNALKSLSVSHVSVLRAFAHGEMFAVMLGSKTARDEHMASRSRRHLAEWLLRISPKKDKPQSPAQMRAWIRIRASATRELDRAMEEFDLRWRRR
jgi:hypothetical protein